MNNNNNNILKGLRSELMQNENQKKEIENKLYEEILLQCINQIKLVSKNNKSLNTTYTIPLFINYIPINNVKKCFKYINKKLIKEDIESLFIIPRSIYISWGGNSMYINNKLIKDKIRQEKIMKLKKKEEKENDKNNLEDLEYLKLLAKKK